MYTVLAYDIESNRQRQRFFKRLRRFLAPVQKSVFEGRLRPEERAGVERLVLRELDLDRASVRLYSLCAGCKGLVRTWGDARLPPDPDDPLFFFST